MSAFSHSHPMHSLYSAAESIVGSVPGFDCVGGHVGAKFVIEYCSVSLRETLATAQRAERETPKIGMGSRIDELWT